MPNFPITAKLIPRGRNLAYLAGGMVLSRLATGGVRVWENRPSKLDDPKLTTNQKRLAFWERLFVEMFGTTGFIAILHFGQDLLSKFYEARAHIPVLKNLPGFTPQELDKANEAIQKIYGPDTKGLIHRILYGESKKVNGQYAIRKASTYELRNALGDELFAKLHPHIRDFINRMCREASMSVLGGIALSAVFGGVVTQAANDYLVSPFMQRFIKNRHPEDGAVGHQSGPEQSQGKAPGAAAGSGQAGAGGAASGGQAPNFQAISAPGTPSINTAGTSNATGASQARDFYSRQTPVGAGAGV